jgi:hypothetical protein
LEIANLKFQMRRNVLRDEEEAEMGVGDFRQKKNEI